MSNAKCLRVVFKGEFPGRALLGKHEFAQLFTIKREKPAATVQFSVPAQNKAPAEPPHK